jgi:hypothetical protein
MGNFVFVLWMMIKHFDFATEPILSPTVNIVRSPFLNHVKEGESFVIYRPTNL